MVLFIIGVRMSSQILAIDQGTTNSRAMIFNDHGSLISQHQIDLTQSYPEPGWVEQNPEEIWRNTVICCREALLKSKLTSTQIAAIGISNQRETTILWNKKTGVPIYPAIVWQDRRTASLCRELSLLSITEKLPEKTGLRLDPYFSATKIIWLLNQIKGARDLAERGDLLFGTVDTFLIWRLTKGKVHATDATNASRTLLFNIVKQDWDEDILTAFNIPKSILPEVKDCSADFGKIDVDILGTAIPITGVAGDQQAATIGQACFKPGMVKCTYGTGCFMLMNTGSRLILSKHQLLGTIAYRLEGKVVYGLEGSIFSAGSTIKWLRDTLKLIKTADESEILSKQVPDTDGVYLVPGFTGLGAPYWDPDARGAILGLTRNSTTAHIVRAALESTAYQSRDLLQAMRHDSETPLEVLRVDGGMAANHWLLQFLADILMLEVQKPLCIESSALGAAYLAGLYVGVFDSLDDISKRFQINARFIAAMSASQSEHLYMGWQKAVERVLTNH